ncbi:MAG: peptide chain release factor 1 [bacterium]|jgi:peptide chain release factor 1|nr:peptide chain release factor 1 [bacterium]
MHERLKRLQARHDQISEELGRPETMTDQKRWRELSREHKRLAQILETGRSWALADGRVREAREILASESDPELREMAEAQLEESRAEAARLAEDFNLLIVPRDPADSRNCIVELRAGTGGEEAALFVADLMRMYQRLAEQLGWRVEVLEASEGGMGGLKEVIFGLTGEEAYGRMKYEGGVHRVQRVPATESQGRIHTSAASVAVLPEAEEVDVQIEAKDLRIDVYRSSGPGGQSVNTTDSAVRITHLPTGLVVTCQDEKSQHKNKDKALKVLRSRLYDARLAEEKARQDTERRSQVSTGDRSAKIRTYNFPQNRVTDHRINLTLYKLDRVMEGDLLELLDALRLADLKERLERPGPDAA